MGYTHYWYRPQEIDSAAFQKIETDCQTVMMEAENRGLKLAGTDGNGEPELSSDFIGFNGASACGHKKDEEIGLCWPAPVAAGVAAEGEQAIAGSWFADPMLATRACNGDCSYESFVFERTMEKRDWQRFEQGYQFDFTKTNYRPYDIVVTACLIVIKHHCPAVYVMSDGQEKDWFDGAMLCQSVLGYGLGFKLDTTEPKEAAPPKPDTTGGGRWSAFYEMY